MERITFQATLHRPKNQENWTFLKLPKTASDQLPSRGQVSIQGTLNTVPFQTTLQPDGQGGHWLKVDPGLQARAAVQPNDLLSLEIAPMAVEPEPEIPTDLQQALDQSSPQVQTLWSQITPAARRDWIHWITSPKQDKTRQRRIHNACDMLSKGKRRPCCFDRSGLYSKSLSCPEIADQ
jgi:hypothetical protein